MKFLPDQSTIEARWITSRLADTAGLVNDDLREYRFDEAASRIYQFFWGELCDWYLEIVKLRLDFSESAEKSATTAALTTFVAVFEGALRLLSPFMPFITEEVWHALYGGRPPSKSIALATYPDSAVATALGSGDMRNLQELISETRALRKDLGVAEKETVPIKFYGLGLGHVIAANSIVVEKLARVSSIEFVDSALTGDNARSTPLFDVQVVYERQIDVPAERERLGRDLAKYEKGLTAAERQLANDAFMAKAPAHIVEGLRKQAAETRTLYEKTKAALDALAHGD
jgi:valyl-tRNA synthetase